MKKLTKKERQEYIDTKKERQEYVDRITWENIYRDSLYGYRDRIESAIKAYTSKEHGSPCDKEMKKYKVVFSVSYEVEAEDKDEAIERAEKNLVKDYIDIGLFDILSVKCEELEND